MWHAHSEQDMIADEWLCRWDRGFFSVDLQRRLYHITVMGTKRTIIILITLAVALLPDCSRGVSEHATECAWCDHNQSHSCDIERRIIQQNDQRTDSGRSARSESKWEQSLCGWQNHHRIRTLPTSETRMGRTPVHPNFETRRNNIRIHSVRFWRKGLRPRSQGCFLRDAYPPEMRDPVQKETPAVTIKSHTRLPWYITWPRIHAVNCNVHRVKKFKSKQRLKDFLYENGFLEEV